MSAPNRWPPVPRVRLPTPANDARVDWHGGSTPHRSTAPLQTRRRWCLASAPPAPQRADEHTNPVDNGSWYRSTPPVVAAARFRSRAENPRGAARDQQRWPPTGRENSQASRQSYPPQTNRCCIRVRRSVLARCPPSAGSNQSELSRCPPQQGSGSSPATPALAAEHFAART